MNYPVLFTVFLLIHHYSLSLFTIIDYYCLLLLPLLFTIYHHSPLIVHWLLLFTILDDKHYLLWFETSLLIDYCSLITWLLWLIIHYWWLSHNFIIHAIILIYCWLLITNHKCSNQFIIFIICLLLINYIHCWVLITNLVFVHNYSFYWSFTIGSGLPLIIYNYSFNCCWFLITNHNCSNHFMIIPLHFITPSLCSFFAIIDYTSWILKLCVNHQ